MSATNESKRSVEMVNTTNHCLCATMTKKPKHPDSRLRKHWVSVSVSVSFPYLHHRKYFLCGAGRAICTIELKKVNIYFLFYSICTTDNEKPIQKLKRISSISGATNIQELSKFASSMCVHLKVCLFCKYTCI